MNPTVAEKLPLRKVSYLVLLMGILILFLDQLTKFLTYRYIPGIEYASYGYPYGGIGVFYHFLGIDFSINYLTNKGAAWGVLGNYQLPLVFVRMGMIAAMAIYLFFFNRHKAWEMPIMLIMMGALGNVIDYFVYGQVIDMLHFVLWGYDFPVFNVADSVISIGVAILFILSIFKS